MIGGGGGVVKSQLPLDIFASDIPYVQMLYSALLPYSIA